MCQNTFSDYNGQQRVTGMEAHLGQFFYYLFIL